MFIHDDFLDYGAVAAAGEEQEDLLREIEREEAPFRLIAIPEDRARMT